MTGLVNKRVLLGVSGGIAAYKTAYLARLLVKAGAEVRVVMTEGAKAFVQPLTFQALTGNPVHDRLLDDEAEAGMGHIELARWADLVFIAPASADLMARLASGMANDLLTTLCLATPAPVHLAPAMNQGMWQHPATQRNLSSLKALGYHLLAPAEGEQACGDQGPGRLPEPEELLEQIALFFQAPDQRCNAELPGRGLKITLTAGPTQEPLDPVRYLSNHSSGKMGFALAQAAAELGAKVHLIAGPVQLSTPPGVQRVDVVTAQEMLESCQQLQAQTDIFIACAAVADYRVESIADQKIKKQPGQQEMLLKLVENPDILATLATSQSSRPFCVGFAAETQAVEDYARRKLEKKNLDAIIANDVSDTRIGFGSDHNQVTFIYREKGEFYQEALPLASKIDLSRQLLLKIFKLYSKQDLTRS
ncbi:phosphopantothenoylcysteine decarboxylase / phosphopantothenate--cysteine ligase [Marinospirillum celere]|uniref:Coenzyme A biosynthesis bifunctional protein CoaBC n=1 Tax=Marinospirillum celere TaxID=1122252 RepID=A0A1I1H1N6_9GAMM|nr:bifunctional phosphopantothenoylcysteine decarboxylase/phosphopantothenate--cysteine ligase CoaBC [Marinospirillum celere]SFC18059.1 phosphopantothenoylcysteine decarboxylase / phosphopantothenate--cysteine ligase [Marinospirillum celere]